MAQAAEQTPEQYRAPYPEHYTADWEDTSGFYEGYDPKLTRELLVIPRKGESANDVFDRRIEIGEMIVGGVIERKKEQQSREEAAGQNSSVDQNGLEDVAFSNQLLQDIRHFIEDRVVTLISVEELMVNRGFKELLLKRKIKTTPGPFVPGDKRKAFIDLLQADVIEVKEREMVLEKNNEEDLKAKLTDGDCSPRAALHIVRHLLNEDHRGNIENFKEYSEKATELFGMIENELVRAAVSNYLYAKIIEHVTKVYSSSSRDFKRQLDVFMHASESLSDSFDHITHLFVATMRRAAKNMLDDGETGKLNELIELLESGLEELVVAEKTNSDSDKYMIIEELCGSLKGKAEDIVDCRVDEILMARMPIQEQITRLQEVLSRSPKAVDVKSIRETIERLETERNEMIESIAL